ncbi:MAG: glutamate-5-semialdehyde dehydrogenase [Candidatus Omnitrophica bacterium]|nr:glutamate-5-semialdehyde dehydrogenase [Candidatus Omnitrophota bacterium]
MRFKKKILKILNNAKDASRVVAGVSTKNKNKALSAMAKALLKNSRYILLQNAKDISIAKKKGLSNAMIDRLMLTNKRIEEMAQAIKAVSGLKDPVGEVLRKWKRPNGLVIKKVRVPIGVVGIVYESRPNVTSDCAALCIKSGNACVLRGGSEAINSNLAIHRSIASGIEKFGIPREAIGMINVTDREAVEVMLEADEYIDLIIPRGGEGLIRHVAKNSTVPVVKHYKGVCHLYVDKFADLKKAGEIAFNAKVQRPGVCNAIENLLVHKDVAQKFLPGVARALEEADVELRGCEKTRKILGGIKAATDKDWYEEYLDLVLAIKVVANVEEAITFINKYGSSHSDAIVTKNKKAADKFLNNVDSSCVYLNASTRFTDGYQFGLGAEIGISTGKIHARGPMALEELCTYKYIVLGNGQIRQ